MAGRFRKQERAPGRYQQRLSAVLELVADRAADDAAAVRRAAPVGAAPSGAVLHERPARSLDEDFPILDSLVMADGVLPSQVDRSRLWHAASVAARFAPAVPPNLSIIGAN